MASKAKRMNIAIDISPLTNGHSVRGTGFYLNHLKNALVEYYPNNTYNFFTESKTISKSVDVVHFPYFDPFFLTLPFIKQHKTVVTVHDLTPLVFPKDFPVGVKGFLKWQIQKRNLQQVDAIITDSKSSQKDIERICGISKEKIHVVYLAAGEQFKKLGNTEKLVIKRKYSLQDKFILYVGDATVNKNLPRLLDAVIKLGVPLVMVGKSLADKTVDSKNLWNKDLIQAQKKVENNPLIKILGFVSDDELVALYNAATLFVMPSLYEGFGLPVLEAMASGCPVVCSRGGSLEEVAGEAAYFVDERNSDSIADGIYKVYTDQNLQTKLSQEGVKQVEKFNWEKTAKQTNIVYQSLT